MRRGGALVLAAFLVGAGCTPDRPALRVVAGAGIADFAHEIVARYRADYPDRSIRLLAGGDVELVDRVVAGSLEADVLLVSDPALLGELQQAGLTSFQLRFAADRMVLALGEGIEDADRDWTDLLLDRGVAIAAADPQRSSIGYRFDFVLQLHDRGHPDRAIADALIDRADTIGRVADAALLREALRAGPVDATLMYASMAVRAGLRILDLPPAIDLGSAHLAAVYAPVTMPTEGGGPPRQAAPILHAVTLPGETPARAAAIDFLGMLLDAGARTRMVEFGLIPVTGADRVVSFGLPEVIERVLEATAE